MSTLQRAYHFIKDLGTYGLVDYTNSDDMKYAIRKLDDTEFKNPWARTHIRVKYYDRSPSRSRIRSRSVRRNRSKMLDRSVSKLVSRSVSRSRSPSPVKSSRAHDSEALESRSFSQGLELRWGCKLTWSGRDGQLPWSQGCWSGLPEECTPSKSSNNARHSSRDIHTVNVLSHLSYKHNYKWRIYQDIRGHLWWHEASRS